jgi:hypothetical protein
MRRWTRATIISMNFSKTGRRDLPKPEPGLVIRYSYLWSREYLEGRQEGVKDRPCAIILGMRDQDVDIITLFVPVTQRGEDALELPAILKRQLGLDDARSWVAAHIAH